MATIPLDELAPGATIRFTVIDGVQYLSIRDFIMHMCDKDYKAASKIWERMSADRKEEVSSFCRYFKFSGQGQQEQPVITFPGAIKLSMFLPGENAKNNRSIMAKILVRYFAGDPSLIQEIEANAQSGQPIAQMARASLAAEEPEDVMISLSRKRVLEDLEIEERVVKVDRQKAETDQIVSETKMKHLRGQFEIFQNVTAEYIELCSADVVMDERARLLFKDSLLNFVVRFNQNPQASIAAPDSPAPAAQPLGFLTISTVATGLGYQFDSAQLKRLGARIAQAYFRKHNESPKKHEQFVDGAVRKVNTYQDRDRALMEGEITGFAHQAGLAARV